APVRARPSRRERSLVEDPLGDRERRVGGWHAGVHGRMQQYLADLLRRDAVAQRGAHVQLELALGAQRREHGERDEAALAPLQARPRPDVAPGEAGDEVLERRAELGRARLRAIDVLVA